MGWWTVIRASLRFLPILVRAGWNFLPHLPGFILQPADSFSLKAHWESLYRKASEALMLEELDRKLLRALQADGRISNQQLADAVGMSASACWRRVRALEEAGILRGYAAEVDPSAAGLTYQAVVHVTLTRHDHGHVETFIAEVRKRPEVLDCFATTGEADYHLRVLCADLDTYNRFLEEFLFRLPGIATVRTNVVLKLIKHGTVLPL
jgi:Lrp/AsnC family transcriptional regulator, leucine-responsive regulatory protein